MKKIHSILIFMLLFFSMFIAKSQAQTEVTADFTDPNFLAEVYIAIHKTAPAPIYNTDLAGITSLSVSYKNISSLAGIEHFIDLQNLSCNNNQLTTLNVANLTNLQRLDCDHNQLTTLDVTNLTNLYTLYCDDNQLTTLDVANLTNLQTLTCESNQLATLDVANLTNLRGLDCQDNLLTTLDVTNLTNLQALFCYNNQLTTLDVTGLNQLSALVCYQNYLTAAPTGYNPDRIGYIPNCINPQYSIAATGVSLIKTSIHLLVGATEQLIVTVPPNNATTINWRSSNEAIASVSSDGLVRALAEGTAYIEVKTADGNKIDSCLVTVFRAAPSSYGITTASSGNGSLSANTYSATEGTTVTLTITPDPDYETDTVSAGKTGDETTVVTLTGTGNTRTFTMPAFDVTVRASFRKTTDRQTLETAQTAIEGANYIVAQAVANTIADIKNRLVSQINPLIASTGITITTSDIAISSFAAAIEGTAGNTAGTNGSFSFTVSLAKGASSLTTASKQGTITATPYTPPATYSITTASSGNGSLSANTYSATEGTTVTLTITPDPDYETETISAGKTGDEATAVTLTGTGNTRTFTMPAFDVTVRASFRKTTDRQTLEAAQTAIEGASYIVAQAVANTNADIKNRLVSQINSLIASSGITITTSDIAISSFAAAIEGTAGNTAGTNGSFSFTVSLAKGASSLTTASKQGTITATAYTPPTTYTVTAMVNGTIFSSEDNIAITGKATFDNQTIAVNVDVKVCIEVLGYKRILTAKTNERGEYTLIFTPQKGEAGHYNVSAYKPDHVSTVVQAEFDIPGMKPASGDWILWEVEQGVPTTGTIAFMNRSAIALQNIRVETVSGLPNATFSFDNLATLPANGVSQLNYTVTGTSLTTTGNWEEIKLRAVSSEGISVDFSVWFYCKPARGVLETNPVALKTFMTRGKEKIVEFELWNYGNGETGDISVSLPQITWMSLASPAVMSSLASNESTKISLRLYPDNNVPLNVPVNGSIAINCANGNSKIIPFDIEAVSESTGTLRIDVVDEYYYNTTQAPHLANAHVKVTHPYSFETVAEGYTDANGIFTAPDLPEGYYALFIEADKHESYRNNILIEAGHTLLQQIFIRFQAITYSWSVVPTEIEDNYEIELITTFETNVPKPVVTIDMPNKMPALSGDETYSFEVKATNHGLIAALDVEVTFPEDDEYTFDYLIDKFDLAAKATQVLPVVMRRKNIGNNSPAMRSANSTGGNCVDAVRESHRWICGPEPNYDGTLVPFTYERTCGQKNITSQITQITQQQKPPQRPCSYCNNGSSKGSGGRYTPPIITSITLCAKKGSGGGNNGGSGGCDNPPCDTAPPCDNPPCDCEKPDLSFELLAYKDDESATWLDSGQEQEVVGVAADGVSKIIIKIDQKKSKNVSICLLNYEIKWSLDSDIGQIDTTSTMYTKLGNVIYKAPSLFNEEDWQIEGTVNLKITITNSQWKTPYEKKIPIKIIRVPVLMVHGIRANYESWKTLNDELLAQESDGIIAKAGYRSWQLYRANYYKTSNSSFKTNMNVVGTKATDLLKMVYNNKYLSSQVDVVAHSMGGLLTKEYIKNFTGNMFRKLITLNTPYGGSQLGNFLTDKNALFLRYIEDKQGLVKKEKCITDDAGIMDCWWEDVQGTITPYLLEREALRFVYDEFSPKDSKKKVEDESAARDLSVKGNSHEEIAIEKIHTTMNSVKCHAIATAVNGNFNIDIARGLYGLGKDLSVVAAFPKIAHLFGYNGTLDMFSQLFREERHDMIVSVSSQSGNLTGSNLTERLDNSSYWYGDNIGTLRNFSHVCAHDNNDIINRIKTLLTLPEDDPAFSDGFPTEIPHLYYDFEPKYNLCDTFTRKNSTLPDFNPRQCNYPSFTNAIVPQRQMIQNEMLNINDTIYLNDSISIHTNYTHEDRLLYINIQHSKGISEISNLVKFKNDIVSFKYGSTDTIYIPAKTRGNVIIKTVGKTPENYYLMDSVTVYVDNILNQTPVSLQFDELSDTLYLFKNQYIKPSVKAIWADGDTTDVEPAFTTSDVSKAFIDNESYIWGRNEGVFTLTATAENQSCNIPVKVLDLDYLLDSGSGPDDDNNTRHSVCASVSMQFGQQMAMTREAFRGTLTIHNGHESIPMQNVALNLEVKDAQGNNCNNLFHIETESLQTLTGVDGAGVLSPQSDGTAIILFIPTVNAAPTEAKTYSFGGTLSYTDPFTGSTITAGLFPVTLEVHPSPNLHLYYFMQRDILGDDPLTEPVEPSIPAELAVMIDNQGYGTAKNLTIESAQPTIIDNQKGLLINFNIAGSSLNGRERQLGLTDIHFGDMPGRSQMVGQWWFTSSLLGHFTSYQSRVKHLDSRGNPDLSLVDTVEIHELIHSITAYGDLDDGISDFLVNDIPDANDYPDAIYFSNATKTGVVPANTAFTEGIVTELNPVVTLTVRSSAKGWNYAKMNDPAQGRYRLVKVTREDNQEIPITNVWQTACTLPDSREPVYENKLHFVDTFPVAGWVNYTLVFEKINTHPLQVDSITGVPAAAIKYPLEKVTVHFNKPVYQPTFTWRNMELHAQGGNNIMDSTVTLSRIDDATYSVDFGEKTQASGYYTFTVQADKIYDMDNLPGEHGKQVSWIQQIPPVDSVIIQTICEGGSYNFNGKILTGQGVYQDTIRTWNGVDSIVQLVFIVNPIQTTQISKQICSGSSYSFFGTDLTASGIYEHILQSAQGCDSVIRLDLTVENCSAIDEIKTGPFRLYPNPAKGNFTVAFDFPEKRDIKICTLTGQIIYHQTHAGKTVEINMPATKNGIYIIIVNNKDRGKLIITH